VDLFWLFFIFAFLLPMFKQKKLEHERYRLMRSIEIKRGSRVIALIHRQETFSFLGMPIRRFINIEDSEQILRAIRMTPDDMPIDLILHTPGGLVLASEQIAHAIQQHKAKVTVFVPHYAMSGGTMIALAADEIVMDPNAVLGPVDPQIGQYPAASILKVKEQKNINEIDDETLILADVSEKAMKQVKNRIKKILESKVGAEKAEEIAKTLAEGQWTHDYPITCKELAEIGLPVCGKLPEDIYKLMDLFPQPMRESNVQYIPLPYKHQKN